MKSKPLRHIINERYRELHNLIERILPAFDSEDIHRFRVAYKKLRAFFRMLSYGQDKQAGITFPGKLKHIYQVAGQVRDLQLLYQQVLVFSGDEGKVTPACLASILAGIDEMKPLVYEMIAKEPVKQSKKKTSRTLPHEFESKYFVEFLRKKRNKVDTIIWSGDFSDTRLHCIRKNLKDLVYNIDLKTGKHNSGKLSLKKIWNVNDWRNFALMLEELGTYHDKAASLAILKNSRHNGLRNCDRRFIKNVRTAWIKDKAELKRLLVKKLLRYTSV